MSESERLRRALRAIVELRERLDAERARGSEPIAVVSMACRFPGGVTTPEELWTMLEEGRDVVTGIPKERFDVDPLFDPEVEATGKTYTRWGGFIGDVTGFDPRFFGMSPREARGLDPQERVLLETTWQLFERVGLLPEDLNGSATGVYVGLSGTEYLSEAGGLHLHTVDGYSLLGTAHSAMVGRLSYWLGLTGPNFPVDTACSSSMVGLHVACAGLRNGDCDMAVAGGVNLLLSAWAFVYFCRLRAMSPTGRCHSFSELADGYVRAEGCGLVLLKRLSDAERDGDTVLALIRGTALNQDGKSNGFTAPNGPAQQAVIRRALAGAEIEPASVDYVECHGTGTALGDPIEVQALAAVYGEGRAPESPVVIGSVKSNMGHAESAAGIGSVLKGILALMHGEIPKTLHVDRPSSHIPWEDLPVRLAAQAMPWPRGERPRRVGVSSFGFSGTNGHVVLEEAPLRIEERDEPAPVFCPLLISGRSEAALNAQAANWARWLGEHPEVSGDAVRRTAAVFRHHFKVRATVAAASVEELAEKLEVLAEGKSAGGIARTDGSEPGGLVFLFTGQGVVRAGMGKGLYGECAVFKDALDRVFAACDPHLDRTLKSVVFAEKGSEEAALLTQTQWAQPAIFALETALFAVWKAAGVKPSLLLGHSIGEVIAAHVAGVFSLQDAAALVCARGRLMQACPANGAMVSLEASEEEVVAALEGDFAGLSVAGLNTPSQTVVSGDEAAALGLMERFESEGRRVSRLEVSHAFHSAHMDSMLEPFLAVARGVRFNAPRISLVSNVTGELATDAELCSPEYWGRHVRGAVRFYQGMKTARAEGGATFVECGPRGVLCAMGAACLPEDEGTFVPSLRRGRADAVALGAALGQVYLQGVDVRWRGLFDAKGSAPVLLPTYPFQKKRYWIDGAAEGSASGSLQVERSPNTAGAPSLLNPPLAGASEGSAPGSLQVETTPNTAAAPSLLNPPFAGASEGSAPGSLQVERILNPDGDPSFLKARLAGASEGSAPGSLQVERTLNTEDDPFLLKHRLGSSVVVSSTLILDWMSEAARDLLGLDQPFVSDLRFERALALTPGRECVVRFEFNSDDSGEHQGVCLRREPGGRFEPIARARVSGGDRQEGGEPLGEIRARCGQEMDLAEVIEEASRRGYALACFDHLKEGYRGDDELLVCASLGDGAGAGSIGWSAVRAAADAIPFLGGALFSDDDSFAVPVVFGASALWGAPGEQVWFHARRLRGQISVSLYGEEETRIGAVLDIAFETLASPPVREPATPKDAPEKEKQTVLAGHLEEVTPGEVRTRLNEAGRSLVLAPLPGSEGSARRLINEVDAGSRMSLVSPEAPLEPSPSGVACRDVVWFEPEEEGGEERLPEFKVLWQHHVLSCGATCEEFKVVMASGATGPPAAGRRFIEELGRHRRNSGLAFATSYREASGSAVVAPVIPVPPAPTRSEARPSVRREDLLTLIRESLAEVLDAEVVEIAPGDLFSDMGFDSLVGVEFRNRVNERTGLELSAAMAYDYPTPRALADHLVALLGAEEPAAAIAETTASDPTGPRDPVPPLAPAPAPAKSGGARQRQEALLTLIRESLAEVLDSDISEVAPNDLFNDMGFDSLVGVEFRNRINERTGLELPAAMAYDYPTPVALAAHLAALLGEPETPAETTPEEATPPPSVARPPSDSLEPIAIISLACRLPGDVSSPEEYWRLLKDGVDAVGPFPERWSGLDLYDPDPDAPGKTTVREGGFLSGVEEFDAGFFGIAPREAEAMDPQQRLALEVSWEALERGGIVPSSLEESETGVFIGSIGTDYRVHSLEELTGYQGTGSLLSVISGRIAYTLGLRGPALTVDTACSSSLVALHLACAALRSGECTLALAGGVQVMSTPGTFVEFSRLRGLSRDGRCRSFSAGADGTGWGEGVGIVVLKPLSLAKRDGDTVLAVITGSAVNQDGRSQGLTAPNGPSQSRLIRRALKQADLVPDDIDYVETHGTGTTLGDPIEAGALLDVFGGTRADDRPLYLTASKSNLGHTQAAAGVVSVIRAVLNLEHGTIARTLYAEEPSPHIPWAGSGLQLAAKPVPWPRQADRVRRVGVSSFGLSGTNAHLVVEEAPTLEDPVRAVPSPLEVPLLISGRDGSGCQAQARRWGAWCGENPGASWRDVVGTAALGREHFATRAAVYAEDAVEAGQALAALVSGRPHPGLIQGKGGRTGRLAFLFTGQGSQVPGMGRRLYESFPVFQQTLDEVGAAMASHLDTPIIEVLFAPKKSALGQQLHQTGMTQPALFAFEVALYRLWNSWGVLGDRFLGHSIGEWVAAHLAGVVSLSDAVKIVCARGNLMQGCRDDGAMASLDATEEEVLLALEGEGRGVNIAGLNGPGQTVVSGDADGVAALVTLFEGRGRRATALKVSHGFHSAHMDSMLDQFKAVLETCSFHPAEVPIISNVTGHRASDEELASPEYWCAHVRQAVRFAEGVTTLHGEGVTCFVECGPGSALCGIGAGVLPEAVFVPSMRRGRDEVITLSSAVSSVFVNGHPIEWGQILGERRAPRVNLPTVAFVRERCWQQERVGGLSAGPGVNGPLVAALASGDVDGLAGLLSVPESHQAALRSVAPYLSAFLVRGDTPDSLGLYEEVWRRAEDAPLTGALEGTWLLVGEAADAGPGEWVEAALKDAGAQVRWCAASSDPTLLRERLLEGGDAPVGVLVVFPGEQGGDAKGDSSIEAAYQVVTLARILGEVGFNAPLWLVTQAGVEVEEGDRVASFKPGALWGLGRALSLELPARWGGMIDLPLSLSTCSNAGLIASLTSEDFEDQIALRASGRWVRRVRPCADSEPMDAALSGGALITGGTGALGAHTARWLAARGVSPLILTSRRGDAAPGVSALRAELEALGAEVTVCRCDVSDFDAVSDLLETLDQEGTGFTRVIHTAGAVEYAPLLDLDRAAFERGFGAKVGGAWNLHRALLERPLEDFILYGSIAGFWGSGEQAPYCAANGALEGLARLRRGQGLPGRVISWGPWAGLGMVVDSEAEGKGEDVLRRRGLTPLSPERALLGLARVLGLPGPSVAVVDVNWALFGRSYASMRPRPLLGEVHVLDGGELSIPSGEEAKAFRAELGGLEPDLRPGAMLARVCAEIAGVLGLKRVEEIAPEEPLEGLGLDSLMAVELRERLAGLTGAPLGATVAFDYPTPEALSEHLLSLLGWGKEEEPVVGETPSEKTAPLPDPGEDPGVPDVETMATDDLLFLLKSKYGEEGDA